MPNALVPPALASWLIDHHGVVTTATLRQQHVGRKAQDRLVEAAVLRRVCRGVFVSTLAPATLEHRCRLLCCLHPDGFVTGPTAGSLADLRRQPVAGLHFATLHGRRNEPLDGVQFRQTTVIASADRFRRADGIVVAAWPRLAFDLAADLRQLDHQSVIHQLLDRRVVTILDLVGIGRRLCHPGRRGSTTFERTLASVAGVTPQDSHAEVILRGALVDRCVPVETQVPVRGRNGITFHVDLGVPAVRWGVELDIHPEHRTVDRHHRDARRARTLHDTDWQIEPVSELDMHHVAPLADELASLYRARVGATRGLGDPPGGPSHLGRA